MVKNFRKARLVGNLSFFVAMAAGCYLTSPSRCQGQLPGQGVHVLSLFIRSLFAQLLFRQTEKY